MSRTGLRRRVQRRKPALEYGLLSQWLYALIDIVAIVGSGYLAYFARFSTLAMPAHYHSAIAVAVIVCLVIFQQLRLYREWIDSRGAARWQRLIRAWAYTAFSLVVLAFLLKASHRYSRLWFGYWILIGGVGLIAMRAMCNMLLTRFAERRNGACRVVLVGRGPLIEHVAHRARRCGGFRLCRAVRQPAAAVAERSSTLAGVPVLPAHLSLAEFVQRAAIEEVWFCLSLQDETVLTAMQRELRHTMVAQRFIPDMRALTLLRHRMMEVVGLPALSLTDTPMSGANRMLKAVEDHAIAAFILLLVSPLMLVIGVGVKLSSPGPVFYVQERVGWNGIRFRMLKFRSMPVDTEAASGPVWAQKSVNRATRFGSFLRRTSLDELPQFINVLKGDMSIVGPRPERPAFVDRFREEIPRYMQKHLVKAGITGMAQIKGWRGNTDLHKRIEWDLYYVENWSLWLDLKIIVLTIFRGFVHVNAY